MPNQILKEMLHAYSNIPLGLLIFKEKKLFFLNKYMRNIVVLGDLDTENSVKVICSTLNLEPNQEALLNFLSLL